jgi:AraC-like DNA-binding protein
MIDHAAMMMAGKFNCACERIAGINDNMVRQHTHPFFELYYLEEGERFHVLDDSIVRTQSDEFIIFAPSHRHYSYGRKDIPFRRVVLYFTPEVLGSEKLAQALVRCSGRVQSDPGLTQLIHKYLRRIFDTQNCDDEWQSDFISRIIGAMMINVVRMSRGGGARGEEKRPDIVRRITEYIHGHFSEELTVKGLAERFYISEYYMCRTFKKHTGQTLKSYINVSRIICAQYLIMHSSDSFTKISEKCGFNNSTNFNRVFRDVSKMTPTEFKRQCAYMKKDGVPGRRPVPGGAPAAGAGVSAGTGVSLNAVVPAGTGVSADSGVSLKTVVPADTGVSAGMRVLTG